MLQAKLLQLCPTLCDPKDHSPPGSSVHRVLQARILEWVAMPSSGVSSSPRDWTQVSCIAGGFFTNRTTREALELALKLLYSVTFLMKPGSKTLLLSILKSFIVTGMQNLLTFLLYLVSSANVSFICKCKFLARKTELDPPNPVREELVLPFSTRL